MQTIFVTGSDTEIGKTHVAASIGRLLAKPNQRIQFIKPVETGISESEPGDAAKALRLSGLENAESFTLLRFKTPLAPLTSARLEGKTVSISALLAKMKKLPPADLRIVEGAGGIAVPISEDGSDWADFSKTIGADRTVIVVADRLGAINQARLAFAFASAKNLSADIWLNELKPESEQIRKSNRETLSTILSATQRFGNRFPENLETVRKLLS